MANYVVFGGTGRLLGTLSADSFGFTSSNGSISDAAISGLGGDDLFTSLKHDDSVFMDVVDIYDSILCGDEGDDVFDFELNVLTGNLVSGGLGDDDIRIGVNWDSDFRSSSNLLDGGLGNDVASGGSGNDVARINFLP